MFIKIKYPIGIIAISISLFSCSKEAVQPKENQAAEIASKSPALNPREGFVYTMSNDASSNSILSYVQSPHGKLTYSASTVSGGNGSGAGLGSQGSIVIDEYHQWLFAVNAGSNSVSSFQIGEDGSLRLASTAGSNGTLPISLTTHGGLLYVVNSGTSNISGYRVESDGTLDPIPGSARPLSAVNAGPAQIAFTPDGNKLVVTEKNTNKITTYVVNANGLASPGTSINSAGQTPFGFDFAGAGTIVVTEASGGAPNASTVSSYSVFGNPSLTSGPIANNQSAACWAAVTKDGRHAYVTNTGSNNISSFEVARDGKLNLINGNEAATGATPIDIALSGNGFYIYDLNAGSHSISAFKVGGNEALQKVGDVEGLPAHAVGLASF